jgi:hypothetical protein
MAQLRRARGGLTGVLAASLIGCLGGLFVGAIGRIGTVAPVGYYYADGIFYGFVGGAIFGSVVGLAAGAAFVPRLGNGLGAFVGGVFGWIGAAVFGIFAFDLAVNLEGMFRGAPAVAGLLGAILFAAVAGLFAGITGAGRRAYGTVAEGGERAAPIDLLAGAIAGAFAGLLGGTLTEIVTSVWSAFPPPVATTGTNVGLFFGFYVGAGVGAGLSFFTGAFARGRRG